MYGLTRAQLVDVLVGDHRRHHVDCDHADQDLRQAALKAMLDHQVEATAAAVRRRYPDLAAAASDELLEAAARDAVIRQ